MALRTVGVVGLGLFGRSVALALARSGVDVLAVDREEEPVLQIRDQVTRALRANVMDLETLRACGLLACDVVVVSVGEDMGSSILVTALLKQAGVRHIIARSHSPLHAQVLMTVGAERTLDPEEEMGFRLADEILAPDIHARIRLSTGQEIIEVTAPPQMVGKTIQELAFRQRYRLNVIAIKRPRAADRKTAEEAFEVIRLPRPEDLLEQGDVLVLIGDSESVRAFLDL
ncbi:MAG TPA: TrkA family potassium uptake protein [Myxococcota bacterium]|nr:TrkA family potassium uptake protein [Myxococcota bacterium]HQK51775.1 TrkA family potassium uptake protein [Myxococcota bacterium]